MSDIRKGKNSSRDDRGCSEVENSLRTDLQKKKWGIAIYFYFFLGITKMTPYLNLNKRIMYERGLKKVGIDLFNILSFHLLWGLSSDL